MIETKKDRRRRDKLRMKAKARRVHPTWRNPERRADYLAMCSCWMCGNPRRRAHKGEALLTLQERKAGLAGESDVD